jgi:chromosomal replication initiation ATPase DnaA
MRKNIEKTIDRACSIWGVTRKEVLGRSRERPLPFARAMIAKTLRDMYGMTLLRIGFELNRNHSTIVHYLKVYDAEFAYNKEFRNFAHAMKDVSPEAKTEFQQELEDEFNEIYG